MHPLALIAADLPAPPALERWFLEQPSPAVVALVTLGAIWMFVSNQRAQVRRGAIGLGAALVLAAGVFALATAVETPRERAIALSRTLIDRVLSGDVAAVEPMISESLVVAESGRMVSEMTRASVLAVAAGFGGNTVQQWSAHPQGAVADAPGVARAQVTIRVTLKRELGATGTPSTWEFTWRDTPNGGAQLVRLECLTVWGQNIGADTIRRWATQLGAGRRLIGN